MIRVQENDFNIGKEVRDLTAGRTDIGAIVTFTGTVRDSAKDGAIASMTLEHYPGMTEQALTEIVQAATKRWSLNACRVIHRYGNLKAGEQIMMVATASQHRKVAFEAAEYLMNYLKTDAPFWKKEHFKDGANWVESKAVDDVAKDRWTS